MTALTHAERLLRHLAELKWMPDETAKELRAAADALAAERERRGEPSTWMINAAEYLRSLVLYGRDSLDPVDIGELQNIAAKLAAPPLPPATGEGPNPLRSFDARDWAREFVRLVREKGPSFATDEGNMIGWFANALMRGYDEHAWRHPARPTPEPSEAMARAERALFERTKQTALAMNDGTMIDHAVIVQVVTAALAAQEG